MALNSLSQARVIDPVLTSVAQGFKNLEMIGGLLFPTVQVGLRAGKIISFGREDFMLYNSQRAPGEATKRISFGYSSGNFALVDYSLEGSLPIEIQQEGANGANGFSIDQASMAIRKVSSIFDLRLEYQQAQIARTLANYPTNNKVTLSGTSQWSDFSGTSDPLKDVEAAKEAIRQQTGKRPNLMVMGPSVLASLKLHPKIVDRMKYTGRDIATVDILASLFGVARVVVGEAIFSNDAGTAFSDVWGKDVILAYTDTATLADLGTPTYGYTYQLNGYPLAEEAYYGRNEKSWYFPVTRAEAPYLTAGVAGYLIKNAVI